MVGLDIQDEMGRHEVGHIDNSMKIPLNNGAGCRFEGQFSINKVWRHFMGPCYLLPLPAPHPFDPFPTQKPDGKTGMAEQLSTGPCLDRAHGRLSILLRIWVEIPGPRGLEPLLDASERGYSSPQRGRQQLMRRL